MAFATLLTATVTTPAIHPAGAATQTFPAEADAKVVQGSPTTNFATSSLDVDRTPLAESYVRFAVSDLTGSVQQATLRLFAFNGTNNGPGVYRSDPVWSAASTGTTGRPAPAGDWPTRAPCPPTPMSTSTSPPW